jgi:hypothetical protein
MRKTFHRSGLKASSVLAKAERQCQIPRPRLAVRGTFSPARAWRNAAVARFARTSKLQFERPLLSESKDRFQHLLADSLEIWLTAVLR